MDTPVLLITGALLSAAAALVMLLFLVTRKTYHGFGFWVMGVLSLAVGAAMLIPGVLPGHWLVRLSRNAFLVGGLMLIFHGLIVFREVRTPDPVSLNLLSFLDTAFGWERSAIPSSCARKALGDCPPSRANVRVK